MNIPSKHSSKPITSEGISPRLLIFCYLALSSTPFILAVLQGLPLRSLPNEFASAFGILGFTWMLLSFLLSGRFRTISGRIGIDKTMSLHQFMAIILGLLVLLHPYLYTLSFSTPFPWDMSRQFSLILTLPALISGMLAWVLLPVLIVTAVFRDQFPFRYEAWRWFHGIGAAIVVIASTHHVLSVGRYSSDILMKGFWLILIAVASLTLLRTYLIMPLLQKRRAFKIISVLPAAHKIWHITITSNKYAKFKFKAGQFAWLKIQKTPYNLTEHPFSISSAPRDLPQVRFTIKESGDFTKNIGKTLKGSRAFIDGPHGHFIIDDQEFNGVMMIAGGIGVAPMISIIREMAQQNEPRPIRLLYGNRIESQIAFRDEIEEAAQKLKLEVDYILSEPPSNWEGSTGFIDTKNIEKSLPMTNPEKWLYLLCGPPVMLDHVIPILELSGIPKSRILFEKFSYL